MNRSTIVLGVLLALSLALNALVLARRKPELPPLPSSTPRAAALPARHEVLSDSGRRIEALEERIRELEAEKRILAESGGPDRFALLRDRLRRLGSLYDRPEVFNEPDGQLVYAEAALDVQRLVCRRGQDPKGYVALLRAVYDLALEKPPLPEGPRHQVGQALDELETALAEVRADGAGERLLRELELEGAALEKIRKAVGPERSLQLAGSPLLAMAGGFEPTTLLNSPSGDSDVLENWGSFYGLSEAQKEAARPAARALAAELLRLSKTDDPEHLAQMAGTPEYVRRRHAALQAQLAALRQVEGAWTREQRETVRARRPREFQIMAFNGVFIEEEKE